MSTKSKAVIAIAAGVAVLLLLPLLIAGIVLTVRAKNQDAGLPRLVDVVPVGDWVEVVPQAYWVIGPFGPGFERGYKPEQSPDPLKPCETPDGRQLQWNVKPIIPGALCLDFRKALMQPKTDDTAAYALVYVHSPRDQAGELLLGSDDTITVWLNGALVHENMTLRPGVPDDDKAKVTWKQACNTLLIKVCNGSGDHLFFAKLRSPDRLRASTAKDLE